MIGTITSSTMSRPAFLCSTCFSFFFLSFSFSLSFPSFPPLFPLPALPLVPPPPSSRSRTAPTYSALNRKLPAASTRFTGRIVSTPLPRSAGRSCVPRPRVFVRSA